MVAQTVALIAGGHTFGKGHGAADPDQHSGPAPEDAAIEEQGFGWTSTFGTGKGVHTITSGLEGAWTTNPVKWDNGYFDNLFGFEWEQTKSPAGATQWIPKGGAAAGTVPDAHDAAIKHAPIMFTTDLSMRFDPIYGPISKKFHGPGPPGRLSVLDGKSTCMARLYGRAWRLTSQNGCFRPGQRTQVLSKPPSPRLGTS
jgi:catalase-peroxidase